MYCKKKWRTADGKDPLFGRVDGFQIDPNKTETAQPNAAPFCLPAQGRYGGGKRGEMLNPLTAAR